MLDESRFQDFNSVLIKWEDRKRHVAVRLLIIKLEALRNGAAESNGRDSSLFSFIISLIVKVKLVP